MQQPIVEFQFDNEAKKYKKEMLKQLAGQAIESVLKSQEIGQLVLVSILLTDNQRIQDINKETRSIDQPTDVLSFPLLDGTPQQIIKGESALEDYRDECDPETGAIMLGDVVVSIEMIESQAIEFNHTFNREFSYMVIHSILHLLGYDHVEEDDKRKMRKQEKLILRQLEEDGYESK